MTSDRNPTASPVNEPASLVLAVDQTHGVKEKLELCADNLGSSNDVAKQRKAVGASSLSADKTLANNERVQREVQECANDLYALTETLIDGIAEVKAQTRIALTESQNALAHTEAALVSAQEDEKMAHRGTLRDSATGLPNRDLFDDRMAHAIALAKRHSWTLTVMFLKLDGFKTIDDAQGRAEASRASREIGRRLFQHARAEDAVCRNRDDEFLYLLVNPQGDENVGRIAAGLLKTIDQPVDMGKHPQRVINASIGFASYPENGTTGEQLIINAGIAMRRAKSSSNGYVPYMELVPDAASAGKTGLGDSL
jgi:diguanylate cyclase (GGDEF)-like protein